VKRLILLLSLLGAVAMADSSVPEQAPLVQREAADRARRLWQSLPKSASGCRDFDYWPEGGMRSFYCHLSSMISWAELQHLSPVSVFESGPHTPRRLDLRSRHGFGHYNPAFVRWLGRAFIPGARDGVFRAATQPIYDSDVKPLARIFFDTHEKLWTHRAFLDTEARRLQQQLAGSGTPVMGYGKYFSFMTPGFLSGDPGPVNSDPDGNVVDTAVAFWIRRSIDGTADLFFDNLRALLRTYDAPYLAAR
jgi:hypothetical protein